MKFEFVIRATPDTTPQTIQVQSAAGFFMSYLSRIVLNLFELDQISDS